jgi:histidine triad (HIT) family protein
MKRQRRGSRIEAAPWEVIGAAGCGTLSGMSPECVFCGLAHENAETVFQDTTTVALLDHRPVFPGHTLIIPREHYETLADLPDELIDPFFRNVRLLAQAVEQAMEAHGTFVAINNKVSQSVPHLHVHIVPRRMKDGLRGFFWPRQKYESEEQMRSVKDRIREAVKRLQTSGTRR